MLGKKINFQEREWEWEWESERGEEKKAKRTERKIGKKSFFSSACLVPYIKGTWMFFHYISCELHTCTTVRLAHCERTKVTDRRIILPSYSLRYRYLCVYDQGPSQATHMKIFFHSSLILHTWYSKIVRDRERESIRRVHIHSCVSLLQNKSEH
jgi:hypothetical protein